MLRNNGTIRLNRQGGPSLRSRRYLRPAHGADAAHRYVLRPFPRAPRAAPDEHPGRRANSGALWDVEPAAQASARRATESDGLRARRPSRDISSRALRGVQGSITNMKGMGMAGDGAGSGSTPDIISHTRTPPCPG